MKKNILYTILFLMPVLLLTSCGEEREPISSYHFEQVMSDKGYTILDVTHQTDGNHLNLILLAVSSSETYQFEFYEFISDEEARFFHQNMRNSFEDNRANPFIQNSVSVRNLDRF